MTIHGVQKWSNCTLKMSKKSERFFLTIPSYSSALQKDADESGSLHNHLFLLLSESHFAFARSLWHGCTNDHVTEVTPFGGSLETGSNLTVVDCGSVWKIR